MVNNRITRIAVVTMSHQYYGIYIAVHIERGTVMGEVIDRAYFCLGRENAPRFYARAIRMQQAYFEREAG